MALIIKDRVMESSTTTGTGAMTLAGAYTGFRSFSSVCSTNDTCYYMIEAVDSNGVPTGDWETGLGTYSAANTLTRTTVLASSNSGSAVSFAAGTKRVAISVIASNIAIGADPTATASDTVVNGSASTFMRSDAAPAVQKGSSSQFGIVKVDGTTITSTGGVISAVSGGGGSTAWTLVDQTGAATTGSTWTWSTNVANVDVTGLGSYNELLIVVSDVTASASDFRLIRVSDDGGSTFYATSGNYVFFDGSGAKTNSTQFASHNLGSSGVRSFTAHIKNTTGPIKVCQNANSNIIQEHWFVASTSRINAVRLTNLSGANLTGGSLYVYGR